MSGVRTPSSRLSSTTTRTVAAEPPEVLGVLRGADRERENAGGVRTGGGALQLRAGERGPGDAKAGGAPADGTGVDATGGTRHDQASGGGRGASALDVLPTRSGTTGITAYLSNGGTLEHAQQIAGHASPKTTKLYDRTADTVTSRRNASRWPGLEEP